MKKITLTFGGFRHEPLHFEFKESIDENVVKGQLIMLADRLIKENKKSVLGIERKFLRKSKYGELELDSDISSFSSKYEAEGITDTIIPLSKIDESNEEIRYHGDMLAVDTEKLLSLMLKENPLGIFNLLNKDYQVESFLMFYELDEDIAFIPHSIEYDSLLQQGSCKIDYQDQVISVIDISMNESFSVVIDNSLEEDVSKEKIRSILKEYKVFEMIENRMWAQKGLEDSIRNTEAKLNMVRNELKREELISRLFKAKLEYEDALKTDFAAYSLVNKNLY